LPLTKAAVCGGEGRLEGGETTFVAGNKKTQDVWGKRFAPKGNKKKSFDLLEGGTPGRAPASLAHS